MRFPRSKTHPTEVSFASLVLADHMIAASILLYGGTALGTLLSVGGDPVTGLAVVIALLDPFLDEVTSDGIVPVLGTVETEHIVAPTLDRLGLHVLHLDSVVAVWAGTPAEQSVALDKAVGDELLVLELDPGLLDQVHDGLVIHHNVTLGLRTLNHLTGALVNYLGCQIF